NPLMCSPLKVPSSSLKREKNITASLRSRRNDANCASITWRFVIECAIRHTMDIRFNCPRCGQNLEVEQRGAGMIVDCPSCKEQIEIPRETASQLSKVSVPTAILPPPVPVSPPLHPEPAPNPLCHTCGQGALIRRTKFRMSGPVVAIGFILLIPSAVGMLFGFLMLVITGSASKSTSASSEREIR